MPSDVQRALNLIKLIFGSRSQMGFQRRSLRPELKRLLESKDIKCYPFGTDIGSRFGVNYRNCKSTFLHGKEMIQVLKKYSDKNELFKELLELITGRPKNILKVYFGIICVCWNTIIQPFYSATSKRIKYPEAKAIIESTEATFKNIKNSSNQVDALLECADLLNTEADNVFVISKLKMVLL